MSECKHSSFVFVFDDEQVTCKRCGATADLTVRRYCELRDAGLGFPDLSSLEWSQPEEKEEKT